MATLTIFKNWFLCGGSRIRITSKFNFDWN